MPSQLHGGPGRPIRQVPTDHREVRVAHLLDVPGHDRQKIDHVERRREEGEATRALVEDEAQRVLDGEDGDGRHLAELQDGKGRGAGDCGVGRAG